MIVERPEGTCFEYEVSSDGRAAKLASLPRDLFMLAAQERTLEGLRVRFFELWHEVRDARAQEMRRSNPPAPIGMAMWGGR